MFVLGTMSLLHVYVLLTEALLQVTSISFGGVKPTLPGLRGSKASRKFYNTGLKQKKVAEVCEDYF